MDRKKLDDALHALGQTYAFFNKELDEIQIAVWKSFLLKNDPDLCMKAMVLHMETGRYAPKPKDISDQLAVLKTAEEARKPPPRELPNSDCPPEVSKAWRWALKIFHGYELYGSDAVDDETAERYLILVNEHAKHFNQPLAIPDEYKISSVWNSY